jgi:hypothetical protein
MVKRSTTIDSPSKFRKNRYSSRKSNQDYDISPATVGAEDSDSDIKLPSGRKTKHINFIERKFDLNEQLSFQLSDGARKS